MIKQTVKVLNQEGLHGRPVSHFLYCANSFSSSIWLEKSERRVNAKSLIGVISLGIMPGEEIVLIAEGDDAGVAVEMLAKVINSGFKDEELIQEIKSS